MISHEVFAYPPAILLAILDKTKLKPLLVKRISFLYFLILSLYNHLEAGEVINTFDKHIVPERGLSQLIVLERRLRHLIIA
ncbi:hypothetical protein DICVIV_08360 [Dictyocaulus viviparus]|uniref:Uncharacterized protein n=1 Tax=Dictyocaulus viviparus TaxID=29172 RepID=A0A0D8XM18_DICVI|nr:hypothetical protein DICVIV_08360 [Dictyocaulus viviparus]